MHKLVTWIVVLAVVLVAAPRGAAADPPARSPRVRAADARTAFLLVQGLQRSATIRALVNQLERRDVIVYIELQPLLKRRLAGTMTWITATREHRYVRVSLNPELNTDMAISTLGHELQHALEVANAPTIVSDATLERFYREHGDLNRSQANGWDTEAARVAGDDVRRELSGSARSTRAVETVQQFEPEDWFVVYRRARSMLPP
jgi:hypothetical protein